jgi:hypothetical protein
MIAFEPSPKLDLGNVIITPGAASKLPPEDVQRALRRHARGDWGEISEQEQRANDARLEEGGTIASIFTASNGERFYVLTEADRTVTTVLLPHEY